LIFGIGTDIIEIERVSAELKKDTGLMQALFTDSEIAYCKEKRYPERHFAGKYAAKEAFFKATGTGWGKGYAFDQVEILHDDTGKPEIRLTGQSKLFINEHQISKIHVSISHIKQTAMAVVILEKL
jgi:holo-[acyl-carrier protein] synthase